MRYVIDTQENLRALRIELDKANGLRDAQGNPTPRRARIFRNGVEVTGTIFDPNEHGIFVGKTTVTPEIMVEDDGSAALELPDLPEINDHLGKNGIPGHRNLKSEAELPDKIKARLQAKRDRAKAENDTFEGRINEDELKTRKKSSI